MGFSVGQKYRDFKVTRITEVKELQSSLIELVHEPTGARVMHIANEDPENLFCISFQTCPTTSNGVAHILEHTVLCGSERFPIKDPFFAMSRRSLNTYLNALTGADFTCYPAASQVPKDLSNLFEVYIDAVFHPTLSKYSFLQEGHRLEFSVPTDPTTHLERKGIVFNEMKGALSNPQSRIMELVNENLFPNVIYGINSGGDPHVIPSLTYQQLRDFHAQYYHPSRCLFFFYGNIPLESHLDFIEKQALQNVKRTDPLPPIPLQPRSKTPKHIKAPYSLPTEEDLTDKTIMAFGWLTCHISHQSELLALSILDLAIIDTDASPLQYALLQSGLCKQVGAHLDTEINEASFVIYLRGCEEKNADALEQVIRNNLKKIAEEGLPPDLIENAIHQLEFYRSEIGGEGIPFGLSLFMRAALLRQHGVDPINALATHSLFDEVRRLWEKDPKYWSKLIYQHFLDNTHFVRVAMVPSHEFATQEAQKERGELDRIQKQMSEQDTENLVKKAKELYEFQKQQEEIDLDILPKITLADVPKGVREYPLNKETIGNLQLFYHDTFTNGIVYADLCFDLPQLTEKETTLARLFSILLPQIGCNGRSYMENLHYLQAHTGGVSASIPIYVQAQDYNQAIPVFSIRGKALYRKAEKLFTLLHEIVTLLDWNDKHRIREILSKHYTNLHSTLNQNALRYATTLAASGYNVPCRLAELMNGLTYYREIQKLMMEYEDREDELLESLQSIQTKLLCVGKAHLVITCDREFYEVIRRNKFYGLSDIKLHSFTSWQGNLLHPTISNYKHVIASPVAFTSQVIPTVCYNNPFGPPLSIAASLAEDLFILPKIREQGGAYGCGATHNATGGMLSLFAFRDPHIKRTIRAFRKSFDEIASGHFDTDNLEEAKLDIIQAVDTPVPPGSRGLLAYAWTREGKSTDQRQAFRNSLLELTSKEVIDAVKEIILPRIDSAPVVTFAGQELLSKEWMG